MKVSLCFTSLQFLLLIYFCSAQQNFRLRILHTNDMHARFEEVSRTLMKCKKSVRFGSGNQVNGGVCYGGFARIATVVRKYQNDGVPTLFLNAGDTFSGRKLDVPSYNKYKWRVVAALMNKLKPDVACLGNHEFDLGLNNLALYMKNVQFPMVVANIDWSQEPHMGTVPTRKNVVFIKNGRKIGVIGYLSPSTPQMTRGSTGNIKFYDEITHLKKEVRNLKSNGVDIIIALGHSGYERDKQIAAQVPGLDIVIGGHSHTFLHGNGQSCNYGLDCDVSQGPYPTVVTQPGTGRKVLVIQTMAYTKYLGKLYVDFNSQGEVVNYFGNPMLLDSSVPKAGDVSMEIARWKN